MRGKKYRKIFEKIDKNKEYTIEEALELIKKNRISKFDESIEVHIKTNIDAKKGDQQIRGTVILPHGVGKTKKVAVITTTKEEDAKEANADIVRGEDFINDIKKGNIDFDVLIATPEVMPKLASVARVLGPKGLMPNPKTDTITDNVKKVVKMFKKGKIDFKNDNTGNVHQVVGKISFDNNDLIENIKAFVEAVNKSKGEGVKGRLISKVVICSTMSPGIKISI